MAILSPTKISPLKCSPLAVARFPSATYATNRFETTITCNLVRVTHVAMYPTDYIFFPRVVAPKWKLARCSGAEYEYYTQHEYEFN